MVGFCNDLAHLPRLQVWLELNTANSKTHKVKQPNLNRHNVRFSKARGVLLGILGGGVLPGSSNPDSISGQKM